jgi:putative aldouronate transport system substrate-binding protein
MRHCARITSIFAMAVLTAATLVAGGQVESATVGEEQTTLTMWYPFTSNLITNAGESVVFQKAAERTGVTIEFVHPPAGQQNEQFNLMIASDDLTDTLRNPPAFPGGPEKALNEEYYVDIATLLEYAPNLERVLSDDPEVRRQSYLDSGRIWGIPQVQLAPEPPWSGPFLRQDWLERVGMDVPETIDEWEAVLIAFRDEIDECDSPLIVTPFNWRWGSNAAFVGAFGASFGGRNLLWLSKDGDVVFGPAEPGYRQFLELFSGWYAMGLIDSDFATRDAQSFQAMVTSGRAGSFVSGYGDVGPFQTAGRTDDPAFSLVAAPMPVLDRGQEIHIRQLDPNIKDNRGIVTTACVNPEAAMRWFDYAFSDEGFLLYNYGIEGLSYTMEPVADYGFDRDFIPASIADSGQKPEFTPFMTDNPDGINFWDLVGNYKIHNGPMLRNPLSYVLDPVVYDAMEIWSETSADWVIPPTTLTTDESLRYAEIMSEVDTYYKEMTLKFIMGIEPISRFDAYLRQLRDLGVDEARDIQQAALNRYLAR